jgi:hypothetical protein
MKGDQKRMKKILASVMALALILSMTACGGSSSSSTTTTTTTTTDSTSAVSTEVTGLSEAFAEQPILLTSGGQSADYQMIGTVIKNLGMDYEINNVATSADLGDAKTLVVVVGGSSKGLGAAGIDADGELSRLDELMTGAKNAGLNIIVMHTGGTTRRGDLSDKFITPCFEKADYAIVVEAGDSDGLMAGICASNGIPMDLISSISDVATVLPAAFK